MDKAKEFYNQFLELDYKVLPLNHFSIRIMNDLSLYVLQNMSFDLAVKASALQFFYSCISKGQKIEHVEELYTLLVKNINIIASIQNVYNILFYCMKNVETKRYGELFVGMLSYVRETKKLVLKTLVKIT